MVSRRLSSLFFSLSLLALANSVCFAQAHPRPDSKKFAAEIAKFSKQDAVNKPEQGGIVFTGSSSIRLWDLKKAFPDLPVLNRGFGGSVANDLIVYADQVALRYQPKILVVYTGSNDLNAKLTPAEAMADYTRFLTLVHDRLPETKILVTSVKISTKRIAQMGAVKTLNSMLETWAEDKPWIRWVESTAYLFGEDGKPNDTLFKPDLLHLNEKGYAQWKAILEPVLKEEWAKVKG